MNNPWLKLLPKAESYQQINGLDLTGDTEAVFGRVYDVGHFINGKR